MPSKTKYRCQSCKYRFSRSHQVNLCPFCGKPTVMEDVPSGAHEILREVIDAGRAFDREF
jgi:rRNA maturation endonuclease Nob1